VKKIAMVFLTTVLMLCFGACGGEAEQESLDVGEAEAAVCQSTVGDPGTQLVPQPPNSCAQGYNDCIQTVGRWLTERVWYSCSDPPGAGTAPNCTPECDVLAPAVGSGTTYSIMDEYCNQGNPGFADCAGTFDELHACWARCARFLPACWPECSVPINYTICKNGCSRSLG
jgi:hypothetical protein